MPVGMGFIPYGPARSGGRTYLMVAHLRDEADALSGRMDAYHSEADSHRRQEKHKRYADDRFHRQMPFPRLHHFCCTPKRCRPDPSSGFGLLGYMSRIPETVVTNAGPAPGWRRNRSEAEVRRLSENAMDSEDYPYPPHSVCKAESDNSSGATWQSSAGSSYWCAAP